MPHASDMRGDNYNKLITHTLPLKLQWRFALNGVPVFVGSTTARFKTDRFFNTAEPIFSRAVAQHFNLYRINVSWRVIRFHRFNINSTFIVVESIIVKTVQNHLNIKSLGNYSGIHPSLITAWGCWKCCKNDCWKDKWHKKWRLFAIHPRVRCIVADIYCSNVGVIRDTVLNICECCGFIAYYFIVVCFSCELYYRIRQTGLFWITYVCTVQLVHLLKVFRDVCSTVQY